jgi:prepilin-type N-terminal cleavage/methylation domain-containing protein
MSRLSPSALRARLRGDERGFTVIELMVTIVILAVGVFGGVKVFESSFVGTSNAQKLDVGVSYATKAVEDMRGVPYAKLATKQVTRPASTGPDDPQNRLTPGKYQVPGGANEDLVAYQASSAFPEVEDRVVGGETLRIWRIVSWRDEECPIVDLTQLVSTLKSLQTTLTSASALVDGLAGPTGSIQRALTDGNSVLGNLVGVALAPLLSAVTNVINLALKPLQAVLAPLSAPLDSLLGAVGSAITPLSSRLTIDLCDIPAGAVPNLSNVKAITSTLAALVPVLNAVSPVVDDVGNLVHSLVNLNLLGLLGAVVKAPLIVADQATIVAKLGTINSILGGVVDSAGNPAQLTTLVTSLTTALPNLVAYLANPDTTHNTKRVSVAVQVLNDGNGSAPKKPVWVTTVVTDPNDGLL